MSGVRQIFFTGKGGVGKSTVALLAGKYLTLQGQHVLISSLDPAHNTGDILGIELTSEPVAISERLTVQEISISAYLERYFSKLEAQDDFFDQFLSDEFDRRMLKYSPGMEEFAMLTAYYEIIQSQFSYDCFIWDMPSTALALRFFQFPDVSLFWLEKLLAMRRQISQKRKELGLGDAKDPIYESLISQYGYYDGLRRKLTDESKAAIYIIVNDDNLSRLEGARLKKSLLGSGIENFNFIMNRAGANSKEWVDDKTGRLFKGYALPASKEALHGKNLDSYIEANSRYFELLLTPNQ